MDEWLLSFYNGKLLTSTPGPVDYDININQSNCLHIFLESHGRGFSFIKFHRNGEILEISNEEFFNKLKEIFGEEKESVSESN